MKIIRFLYENGFDTGTLTYSSALANFPATNVRHRWWTRAWRTAGKINEWIKLDKGAPYRAEAFVVKYNNFTAGAQVILQANNSDSWTNPPLSVVLSPVSQDVMIYFFPTPLSFRWWRLLLSDSENASPYLTVGRVYLGPYWSPSKNFNNEYEETINDPSYLVFSEGGQLSGILRTQYRRFTYFFEDVSKSDRDNFRKMFSVCGLMKDLFVCRDADDAYASTSYVRIAEPLSITHRFMDAYYSLTLTFEELR